MEIIAIVAMAKNGVIGKGGKIPWHLSEDLKRFKEITTGNVVIMGRKTYESIGKPLSYRANIVISRNYTTAQAHVFSSIEEAIEQASTWSKKIFIIGGAEIYKLAMPYCSKILLTEINAEIDGDTFFPKLEGWKEIDRETHQGKDFQYSYVTLTKT